MKALFKKFETTFWENYIQKNYKQIVNDVFRLSNFECTPENVLSYRKLCTFSLVAMKANKTINDKLLTLICNKFQCLIATTTDPIMAMQHFICLEYASDFSNFEQAVSGRVIDSIAQAVVNKITNSKRTWTDADRTTLNRFIVVAVQLESKVSLNGWKLKFAPAMDAIKLFSSTVTDDRKTAYTEYLCRTLQALILYRDVNADGVSELLKKFRCLVKSKSKIAKDIAIMMSQIIWAGTTLISKGSLQFKHQTFTILNELYELVRSKSLPACQYIIHPTHYTTCCDRLNTHIGLQILETVRIVFVEALKSNDFNEALVSVMANFATAEEEIIAQMDCKNVATLKCKLAQTFRAVTKDIEKIVTTCGLDRAERTLQKFLAMKSLQPADYNRISKGLLKICKNKDNKMSSIAWLAMDLNQRSMYDIHVIQSQLTDPKQFKTISSIRAGLPPNCRPLNFDSVRLQLLQITVEVNHPILTPMCLRQLVDDMREMDFYQNDRSCYANLCKSGACYLRSVMLNKLYKSNVNYVKSFEPLNEKFVSLNTEIDEIKSLLEALDYLAEYLRDKDVWLADKDGTHHTNLAETLLRRISETLISRHYKDLAVTAFDLFYKFAKVVDRPISQMIAAGYLIENIDLTPKTCEKEVVMEFQRFIMQKLRDVNKMKADELGSYLFSFLQLTMYTMRCQLNIDHAKKYMQAINKLLNKYDPDKGKYLAARLKYAEVMFELIVSDPDTTITPVTFIEDIFHRFKNIRTQSRSDQLTVPGIVLDLLITIYAFTQPRYELRYTTSLQQTVHFAAIRNGYLSIFAKVTILSSSEMILVSGKRFENHMKQLDVIFGSQSPAVPTESAAVTPITWNKEITSLIHSKNCECFQCTNKFLNSLNMEVAAVKASAIYFDKDYPKSLEAYQQIYRHWNALNTSSYSDMLMHYSNCLISNGREDKSKRILNEALDVCNDSAQAQDISVRLLLNATKGELEIERKNRSFADEVRPKAVQPKKKASSKPSLATTATKERITYPKKSNIRN